MWNKPHFTGATASRLSLLFLPFQVVRALHFWTDSRFHWFLLARPLQSLSSTQAHLASMMYSGSSAKFNEHGCSFQAAQNHSSMKNQLFSEHHCGLHVKVPIPSFPPQFINQQGNKRNWSKIMLPPLFLFLPAFIHRSQPRPFILPYVSTDHQNME